tara:strand:- start:5039 stop:5188 length:150 start_codon:yes stop_codon:yes gene_type:complete
LASQLDIRIVLGFMRQVEDAPPMSCLHVISDEGEVVATYDKQRLYSREK